MAPAALTRARAPPSAAARPLPPGDAADAPNDREADPTDENAPGADLEATEDRENAAKENGGEVVRDRAQVGAIVAIGILAEGMAETVRD